MSTQEFDEAMYWSPSTACRICGDPSTGESTAYLCARCKKVMGGRNASSEQRAARFRHMSDQWTQFKEFRCHYTGVSLELDDRTDVRYREWDHATPGDDGSVVLSTALVNRMKCYLNVKQFKDMVAALANHFAHPDVEFQESAIPHIALPPSSQT